MTLAPAVFIYSMPGYSVPIKERMMYSSCRNAVVEVIETTLGIKLEKKIEIDTGAELTEDFLRVSVCGNKYFLILPNIFSFLMSHIFQSELHPVVSLNKPKFAKPQGPSRGNKRLTKTPA